MEAFQEMYQNNNEEKYNKCRKKKKTVSIWKRTVPANDDLTHGNWVLGITQK